MTLQSLNPVNASFSVIHDVSEKVTAALQTSLKSHGGADFFAMSSFIQTVKVCIFYSTAYFILGLITVALCSYM